MARLVTLILVSRCHRVGTCTLVHTWKERLSTIFNPCRFSLSLSFLPRSMSPPPSPCTCFFLPFSTRFIYPSSFYSRTAGSRTRACTHAELNPLCDDERTPLESFDIGDVGKYIEGRIYRIFFPTQSARCSGPDGEFQPR